MKSFKHSDLINIISLNILLQTKIPLNFETKLKLQQERSPPLRTYLKRRQLT